MDANQFLLIVFVIIAKVLESTENEMDCYLSRVLFVSYTITTVEMSLVYYLLLLIKLILLKLIMLLCKGKYLILQACKTSPLFLL